MIASWSGLRTPQFKQMFKLTSSAAVVLASDPVRGTRMARNNGALKLEAGEVVLTLDHLKAGWRNGFRRPACRRSASS